MILFDELTRSESVINSVLLGKEKLVRVVVCSLISSGHILIEDIPGVGKTTLVKCIAKVFGLSFNRIQFTNDLLPSDILGGNIWDGKLQQLVFQRGPIEAQLVLGDELNRASPRTQSACLQAMEEREVTVEGVTYSLPKPFIFIATQNPLESSGVFPLPESQLDRFLVSVSLGLPDEANEKILLQTGRAEEKLNALETVLLPDNLKKIQEHVSLVEVSESLLNYYQRLLKSLREKYSGLSPRCALGWLHCAKACAYLQKRNFVIPEDVQFVAPYVLGHRLNQSSVKNELNKKQVEIIGAIHSVVV
jgi:MoxR-like ATPase